MYQIPVTYDIPNITIKLMLAKMLILPDISDLIVGLLHQLICKLHIDQIVMSKLLTITEVGGIMVEIIDPSVYKYLAQTDKIYDLLLVACEHVTDCEGTGELLINAGDEGFYIKINPCTCYNDDKYADIDSYEQTITYKMAHQILTIGFENGLIISRWYNDQ